MVAVRYCFSPSDISFIVDVRLESVPVTEIRTIPSADVKTYNYIKV